ncbi:MAG TPA: MarR family winged helix-turn-helix transcriptional regulator [Edaphobacter sp.]|jgi:DNA-binding MarR family transcriptional regulator|nr:MarR family winged helix-turn-helix transcriptional regulator [Edaphobacter sp.]
MKRILLQFRGKLDDQLRPNGVTTAQLQVLFAVKANPGSSGAQLARSCYITPQTTQTLLKHLEKAGLIVRGKDPVNDRILTTRITPEGERLMQEVERESLAIQAELWKGVSDEELTQLNALLERCIANLGASEEAENALCSSGKS